MRCRAKTHMLLVELLCQRQFAHCVLSEYTAWSKHVKGSNEHYLLGQTTTWIFGLVSFIKLQNDTSTTVNEKWDVELKHLSGFGWTMLFSCPVKICIYVLS